MSIGGENRVGHVSMRSIEKMIDQCDLGGIGLSAAMAKDMMASLAAVLPEKLASVFDEIEGIDQAEELRARMEDRVASLC